MKRRRLKSLDEKLTLQQTGSAEVDAAGKSGSKKQDELRELLATAALLKAELAPPPPPSAFRKNARIRLENRFRGAVRVGTQKQRLAAGAAVSLRSPLSQLVTGASMLVTAIVMILVIGLVRPVSVAGDPIDLALNLVDWRPSAAQLAAAERTGERTLSAVRDGTAVGSAELPAAAASNVNLEAQHAQGEELAAPLSVAALEAALEADRSSQRAYMTVVTVSFTVEPEPAAPSSRPMADAPSIELAPDDVSVRVGPRERGFSPSPRFQSRDVNARFTSMQANDRGPRGDRPWNRPWNGGGQARRQGRPTG